MSGANGAPAAGTSSNANGAGGSSGAPAGTPPPGPAGGASLLGAEPAADAQKAPPAAPAGEGGKGKAEAKGEPKVDETPGPPLTPEQKAAKEAADKAAAEAAAAGDVTIKLPEGMTEDASLGQFKELAKKHGIKSEQAQAIVDFYAQVAKQQATEFVAAQEKLKADYVEQLKADKDFGGAAFDVNVQLARKAVKAYGDAELKKFFNEHPLGNHPGLVKMLARIGKAAGEDALVRTEQGGGKRTPESERLKNLYPNSPQLNFGA